MTYFYIEPEVAGGLGANTIMDTSIHPPIIQKLHYEISGWLGDVILESFPCLIATNEVSKNLENELVTGVDFYDVEVSVTDDFLQLYPSRKLPLFRWLKVKGVAGKDDFGIAADFRFVISQKVMEILIKHGLNHSITEPYC